MVNGERERERKEEEGRRERGNKIVDIYNFSTLASHQVLLLVDASFGFEMETFEFLNILQTHGFPKVMGVLTHLDLFHSTKTLRKTKKKLKQRFWTEIYQVCSTFTKQYRYVHIIMFFSSFYCQQLLMLAFVS